MKHPYGAMAATILAAPLALQAAAAQAQPVSGFYVAAGAGLNWLQDQDHSASAEAVFSIASPSTFVNGTVGATSRLGFAGVASLGWGFGNGLRAELEGSWRSNLIHGGPASGSLTVDGVTSALSPVIGVVRGRTDQYAVMVNALYDFDIGQNWIYPYIGAGVGYSWQRFNGLAAGVGGLAPEFNNRLAGVVWTSNDTVGRFAYQAIAGAALPITAVPGLSFTAEYRFFGTVGTEKLNAQGGSGTCFFNALFNIPVGCDSLSTAGSGARAKVSEATNHSILIGLRYAFNAAPAAVMAVPVVAPAGKSFLVFFDWDKSTLTDRVRGIIREAAAASKATQHTRIEVNGYADTSGNPKYNQGISMRRAQTVAAELVRNGVAKGEIAIKAFGDTVLLVPTGPGVREPQNRRVEIIIR